VRAPIAGQNPDLVGFADYHAHMFSEVSFGQYLFHGRSYPPLDAPPEQQLAESLPPCHHGELRHTKAGLAVTFIERSSMIRGHRTQGYPTYADWPSHWTMLHQQMYVDWVYRAYRHGLRLMVLTVTHSQTLCESFHRRSGAP